MVEISRMLYVATASEAQLAAFRDIGMNAGRIVAVREFGGGLYFLEGSRLGLDVAKGMVGKHGASGGHGSIGCL